jgi:peptidoglycan/LPS O-acetylase OafA/YrhL
MRLPTMLFNGNAAIAMFFVLSGFVLALSLRRDLRNLWTLIRSFVLHRLRRRVKPPGDRRATGTRPNRSNCGFFD